jgi:hypothetical protein
MNAFFGPRAERIRDALPPGIDGAIVFDEAGAADAAGECARRRAAGERVVLLPLFDGARVRINTQIAIDMSAAVANRDERYYALVLLAQGHTVVNGKPVSEAWAEEAAAHRNALAQLLARADAVLALSNAAYAVLCSASQTAGVLPLRCIALASTVPPYERCAPERPLAVVWPGRRDTAEATLALVGLEEFRGDVAYVGSAPLPHIDARFIARDDPALTHTLARASCVVCIDPCDPTDAVAFARRGTPVVAPVTCAAYEFADGIVAWDAGDGTQLSIHAGFAMGRTASGAPTDVAAPRPPAPAFAFAVDRRPLVSVITATYNRRDFLRRMLTCLAAQTYPNIESIVVNDAGEAVDDIVAAFGFARLVDLKTNCGTYFGAARHGLPAARGEYVAMLPDDDWFYPDHIERLMAAALNSGAAIAHSFAVMRFLREGPDGAEQTYAINSFSYAQSVSATVALIGTPVAMHQCIQRRDTFEGENAGWPLADEVGGDQEYHMRLLERYQFASVDRFTCEFRDHPANAGKAHNWAEATERIYRLHPVPGRPLTEAFRSNAIETLKTIPTGRNSQQPTIYFRV